MARDADHWSQLLGVASAAALEFLETLPERPAGQPPTDRPKPLDLPAEGVGAEAALAQFRGRFEAGLSGSPGPRYLGFVTGGTTPAALVGDWLATAYDQNLSSDGDSIATTVELETLGLLRQLFGLPDTFHGAFVTGATMANAVALAAARQWVGHRLGVDVGEDGLASLPRIPVLAGAPHASIGKALSILGMGRGALERLACVPGTRCLDPNALARRLDTLEESGGPPAIVVASAGEVNTGEFDDLVALAEICGTRAWLHVDGAFGLFAACDPAQASKLAGLERADSIATDGHKWLNVPYDAGLVFTRHLDLQEQVFRAVASYLGDNPDLLHRTPENSRRFRALPAWMTLVAYGREGYADLVRRNCAQARRLGEWIRGSGAYELLADVHLDVVCFAPKDADTKDAGTDIRDRVLARLTADGRVFLTPTLFDGRPGIRAAFVNWSTADGDVEHVIAALGDAATGLV